jgi:hypothetical protein
MSSKSPFNDYLRTNYAPTSTEKAAIEALCTDPLQDIQRLDEEIDKLEEEIRRLLQRRKELQTFVDDHRMLLSPIRQLSAEVLQRIFAECVLAVCCGDCYPVMLAMQATMLMGRVCSSWRRIAYSTPELWNVLHIAIPHPENGEADSSLATLRLEAIKDWLGRTGSLPLHISLFAAPSSNPGPITAWDPETGEQIPIIHDYSHIYQYAEALMESADRWGSLTLSVPPSLLRPWSILSSRTLPMLKDFRLSYSTGPWSDVGFHEIDYADYQILQFLHQTPLESMTLSLPVLSLGHIPGFRKDALTYLDVQPGLAFSDGYLLAHFFSEFVSLRTLQFTWNTWGLKPEFERIRRDSRLDPEFVILPCLKKLKTFGLGDDNCCIVDFWQRIRVPKLQSMTFHFDASIPWSTNSHSHSMFARFMDVSVLNPVH